jgi:hypothetical protein
LGELFFCHKKSVDRGVVNNQVAIRVPAGVSQHGHDAEQT